MHVLFANEIVRWCQAAGVDSHKAVNIFLRDGKLNWSSYGLKPGFVYGDSGLPKEILGMKRLIKLLAVALSVTTRIVKNNARHCH